MASGGDWSEVRRIKCWSISLSISFSPHKFKAIVQLYFTYRFTVFKGCKSVVLSIHYKSFWKQTGSENIGDEVGEQGKLSVKLISHQIVRTFNWWIQSNHLSSLCCSFSSPRSFVVHHLQNSGSDEPHWERVAGCGIISAAFLPAPTLSICPPSPTHLPSSRLWVLATMPHGNLKCLADISLIHRTISAEDFFVFFFFVLCSVYLSISFL